MYTVVFARPRHVVVGEKRVVRAHIEHILVGVVVVGQLHDIRVCVDVCVISECRRRQMVQGYWKITPAAPRALTVFFSSHTEHVMELALVELVVQET
jgi:hypothetical protein